jgi:hypothetical protein
MIYAVSLIASILTVILFFVIDRIKKVRQIVAKILINAALIIGAILLYLFWYFIFNYIF